MALVCSHEAVASALQALLGACGFPVVALVTDPDALLGAVAGSGAELVVAVLPLEGGVDRLLPQVAACCAAWPAVPLVLLADDEHTDETVVLRALTAGAVGWIGLDTDPDRLPHVLRGVLAGEAAVPRRLLRRVFDEVRRHVPSTLVLDSGERVDLTPRERHVVDLLVLGLSTGEAAERIGVSAVTVRGYVRSAVAKTGVTDRAGLVALVTQQGARQSGVGRPNGSRS